MTSYGPRRMPEASANGSGWDYRGCCDSSGFLLTNGVVATNRGRVQNHLIADPSTAGASVESVREIGRKSGGPREEFLTPSHTFQRRARGSQLWAATIREREATVAGRPRRIADGLSHKQVSVPPRSSAKRKICVGRADLPPNCAYDDDSFRLSDDSHRNKEVSC